MSDVLVVRVNTFCKAKEMENIRKYIKAQKETGTVVLPPYCEALIVPEGCEIRIEDVNGNEMKGEE